MRIFYRSAFIMVMLCALVQSAGAEVVIGSALPVTTIAGVESGSIVNDETGTVAGDVYDWSAWEGYKTSGIAGVSYVNRAVDAAGNAAQWAENHATLAAGAANAALLNASKADSAASSAQTAASAAQAVVDAIVIPTVNDAALTIQKNGTTVATFTANSANAVSANIILGALADLNTVATAQISDSAVTEAKIASNAVTSAKISDGAVTVAKTSGIYGFLPAGSDKSGVAEIGVE